MSAHSALQRCSAMIRFGASESVGSFRIIQCTSRNAPNSPGTSPERVIAPWSAVSSFCTSSIAKSSRAISCSTREGGTV